MKDNYNRLRSYCYVLKGENYMDLLHDAYLAWYDKTGKNLFEEPNYTGTKVIRNIMLSQNQKNYFMWRGEKYRKEFIPSVSEIGNQGRMSEVAYKSRVAVSRVTPLDEAIGEDMAHLISPDFGMVLAGHTQAEIASLTGKSQQLVHYHLKKTKNKLSQYINPIAGSRVKLIKKVSVKQVPLEGFIKTDEGNETVDIYIKESELDLYERTGQAEEGVLVKLTKD